jgi:hypothetical protein
MKVSRRILSLSYIKHCIDAAGTKQKKSIGSNVEFAAFLGGCVSLSAEFGVMPAVYRASAPYFATITEHDFSLAAV